MVSVWFWRISGCSLVFSLGYLSTFWGVHFTNKVHDLFSDEKLCPVHLVHVYSWTFYKSACFLQQLRRSWFGLARFQTQNGSRRVSYFSGAFGLMLRSCFDTCSFGWFLSITLLVRWLMAEVGPLLLVASFWQNHWCLAHLHICLWGWGDLFQIVHIHVQQNLWSGVQFLSRLFPHGALS